MEPGDDQFDVEHEVRYPNNLNVTEHRLFEAMQAVGLRPRTQYPISRMTVDFAFPDEKVVIEVDGPLHQKPEQQLRDKKRWFFLRKIGWHRKSFDADRVYRRPVETAVIIKHLLHKKTRPSHSTPEAPTPKQIQDAILSCMWKRICKSN